ncbi:MAG: hypothetical protein H0T48_16615 [Gemmatimonadaceae bacterium]|nr:hypothetical protein [Gemmatimonadaceae bacterium]
MRIPWPKGRKATDEWIWRHELAPPANPPRFDDPEGKLDGAWRELVLIHTSFRATKQEEYRELVDALREIERLFLERPELSAYYDECHQPPGTNVDVLADVLPAVTHPHRHVAAIQAYFMEDVYYVLQLARYANALDNRGWMNLFRSWGQSPTFNAVFNNLRATFAEEFVEFYEVYIRYYFGPIETCPVPHPWDAEPVRRDLRDSSKKPAAAGTSTGWSLPGAYLDSGIQEAGVGDNVRGGLLPSPGTESHGLKDDMDAMSRTDPGIKAASRAEGVGGASGGNT